MSQIEKYNQNFIELMKLNDPELLRCYFLDVVDSLLKHTDTIVTPGPSES